MPEYFVVVAAIRLFFRAQEGSAPLETVQLSHGRDALCLDSFRRFVVFDWLMASPVCSCNSACSDWSWQVLDCLNFLLTVIEYGSTRPSRMSLALESRHISRFVSCSGFQICCFS